MDTPDTPDTPNTPETPETPEAPATPAADATTPGPAPRAARPWGRSAMVAGVSALALVGAATLGALAVRGPGLDAVRHDRAVGEGTRAAGPMARGRSTDRVLVMPARVTVERSAMAAHRDGQRPGGAMMDPAAREAQRAARLAELATELGIDPDALTTAADTLHEELDAERDALREELADATAEERRAAMQAFAEELRARMRVLLIDLGADADAVDALLADHAAERGPMSRRGPRAGHTGGR